VNEPRLVLLDLDETLVVEEPAAVAAFRATAEYAATFHDVDAGELALGARVRARELWYAAPTHQYCKRIGISSWEGLWCRYEGEGPELAQLRAWAPTYRREAWGLALADQGVDDSDLAIELGDRFGAERRDRHWVFPDVEPALRELGATHMLGLATNGASCLQRDKLAASGLESYFRLVVVSSDVGATKPDPAMFRHALAHVGAETAVMVGDSVDKDIRGAQAAGLRAVWLNRTGLSVPEDLGVPHISSLTELPGVLADTSSH
jgi:putative hydrolase of the HAD superfamily